MLGVCVCVCVCVVVVVVVMCVFVWTSHASRNMYFVDVFRLLELQLGVVDLLNRFWVQVVQKSVGGHGEVNRPHSTHHPPPNRPHNTITNHTSPLS